MQPKNTPIYLDHAATTPTDPRVVEAMLPYFTEDYGNPGSPHRFGRKAEGAVETSRAKIASILNCKPQEIIFTSCGTEADNLALRGSVMVAKKESQRRWVLTAHTEHHAVSNTAAQLADVQDILLEWLTVDHQGRVTPESLKTALCDNTIIASVILNLDEVITKE